MRVVAAVIEHEGLLLACRRAEHKSLSGFWEFPGGKVEPGEGDQEALVREVQEELGIQIEVGNFICRSTSNSSGTEIEMFTYFCRLNSAPPTSSSDHDQLTWVSKAELTDLMWPPLDIPVVDALTSNMP
jgi:8-oxo-dGTP diphosphatase